MIVVDLIRNASGELYAKLTYEPQKNYLLMKWIGPCSEEEVKVASMRMFEWQKREGLKNKCRFHVHDTKEIEGAWAGLVDWITNYFFLNYDTECVNISIFRPIFFQNFIGGTKKRATIRSQLFFAKPFRRLKRGL